MLTIGGLGLWLWVDIKCFVSNGVGDTQTLKLETWF